MCFSLSTPIPLIFITATFSVTPCKLQLDTNNLTKKNHTTKQSSLNRHPQFSFYFWWSKTFFNFISFYLKGVANYSRDMEIHTGIPSTLWFGGHMDFTSHQVARCSSITDQRSFHWQDKQTWRNVQHKWNDQRESNLLDQTRENGFNFSSHIPEVKASVNWIICIKIWQWCAF